MFEYVALGLFIMIIGLSCEIQKVRKDVQQLKEHFGIKNDQKTDVEARRKAMKIIKITLFVTLVVLLAFVCFILYL